MNETERYRYAWLPKNMVAVLLMIMGNKRVATNLVKTNTTIIDINSKIEMVKIHIRQLRNKLHAMGFDQGADP